MRQRRERNTVGLVAKPKPSFTDVYDEHVETVYRYVHRRCRDHALAEDITQETFLTVVRSTDDASTITIAWLLTVARNRLFDVLRRKVRYEEKLQLVANLGVDLDDVDIAERLRVEAALGELPLHYRLVLTLHYMNGMTVPAIAQELGRSPKSVEALVTRARRELAAALSGEQPDAATGGRS